MATFLYNSIYIYIYIRDNEIYRYFLPMLPMSFSLAIDVGHFHTISTFIDFYTYDDQKCHSQLSHYMSINKGEIN